MMDFFLDICISGQFIVLISRIVFMNNPDKSTLDVVLPFTIFMLIASVFALNKQKADIIHNYFLSLISPIIGVLVVFKTINQNSEQFYLNESFVTWQVMNIYIS